MKSLTAVCQSGASMSAINPNGRAISRHSHPQRENAEMKMYLSKLKDLVPFMPKNRKLSKLEIIQHVIDYICDLQSELETHPEIGGSFDPTSALNFVASSQNVRPMDTNADEVDADYDGEVDNDEDEGDEAEDGDVDDALMRRLSAEATNQQNRQRQHLHQHHHNQQQQQQQHHLRQNHHQQQHQQQPQQHSSPARAPVRQPLVDRQAPNTILPATSASHVAAAGTTTTITITTTTSATQQHQQQSQQQQQQQSTGGLVSSSSPNSQTTSAEKHSRQSSC